MRGEGREILDYFDGGLDDAMKDQEDSTMASNCRARLTAMNQEKWS
jgi:hypothetical protein